MNDPRQVEQIANALHRARVELEQQRRAQFTSFGIEETCLWPCSQLFHAHSSLGPAWVPALTIAEVEALTRDGKYKEYIGSTKLPLPHPDPLKLGFEQVIRSRRTAVDFARGSVSLTKVAKLLELGSGVTANGDVLRRAAPSGGALYPVETYLIALSVDDLRQGLYHYLPTDHALEYVRPIDSRDELHSFVPPRLFEAEPALLLAFTSVFERIQMKYLERGYRFALLEAGHIAQNVLLTAAAMGLGTVPMGRLLGRSVQ